MAKQLETIWHWCHLQLQWINKHVSLAMLLTVWLKRDSTMALRVAPCANQHVMADNNHVTIANNYVTVDNFDVTIDKKHVTLLVWRSKILMWQ